MRNVLFWFILILIPVSFTSACIVGYFAYRKLTYPGYSCGSFAEPDDQLGWKLRANAVSCLGGRPPLSSSPPWFEATVFTGDDGFRSAAPNGRVEPGGIMAVGDSWTFGFGVPFEHSFPYQLQQLVSLPVATVASPAYSTAQSLLLAQRSVETLRPQAIVFLDMGSWERAACRGQSRPTLILKPCYWQQPGQPSAELVLPPDGLVKSAARWGVLPGGVLGAGEVSWRYFLISRPLAQAQQLLVRLGLLSGFGDDFRAVNVDNAAIKAATLKHVGQLATISGVPVLFLDPHDIYAEYWHQLSAQEAKLLHRIGRTEWQSSVTKRTAGMSSEEISVPNDGHFGRGTNRLVAELLLNRLRDLRITPAPLE